MTFSFMTGVAVSPTTFHFHTALLDKAMWRVPSKIRTASACVASARMRVLRSQRSAHQKQMHSLTQMQSSLLKKTLDMVTIKDITILILGTTNTMAMAMAMGLAVITTMARTNTLVAMAKAMITTMAITLGIIVVMAVTIDKVSKMSDSKKYLKGKII